MAKLVAIDTQIAVWAIKRRATPNREHMIRHAVAFVQQLQDEKAIVLLPTVVVGELLVRSTEDERDGIMATVAKTFRVVPYDAAAAVEAARLRALISAPRTREELRDQGLPREIVKSDLQIIATAVTRRAALYSEDDGIHRIAEILRVDVRRLPQAEPGVQELDFGV